jgi:hypothetical protein
LSVELLGNKSGESNVPSEDGQTESRPESIDAPWQEKRSLRCLLPAGVKNL